MITAVLIEVGNRVRIVRTEPTFEAYYRLLECRTIEVLPLIDSTLYFDEEGKLFFRPMNVIATAIQAYVGVGQLMTGDYIAGPALITGPADASGIDTDVPERLIAVFRATTNPHVEVVDER